MSITQAIPIYTRHRHTARYFIEKLPNLQPDDIQLKMVAIPAGSFVMGAPEEEAESNDYERPQHEVNIPAFCMGKYPITQAQWKAVAGLPQIERELNPDPSYFKGNNLPVERVSWLEAVEFCATLSVHTKREYRLPSEAEWEYGCRATRSAYRESPRFDGSSNHDGSFNADGVPVLYGTMIYTSTVVRTGYIYPPFHYEETITTELVNYNGNYPYGEAPKGEFRESTTEVGKFPPNAFGLHDMHGNVWEWCRDDQSSNYNSAILTLDEKIPLPDGRLFVESRDAQDDVSNKLIRGGSYISHAKNCRSASRAYTLPHMSSQDYGFRVVCHL